jgi:Na+/H+-dicarboxylate symporter
LLFLREWGRAMVLDEVTDMMILVAVMFLLPPVLVTLYLYVSGVFTNRRAFQFSFYFLLVFFALTIGISVGYSYQGYAPSATTPVSLTEVLSEP